MTDLVYKADLSAVSCDSGTFGGTWKLLDVLPHPLILHIFIWQRVPGCFHCVFACHVVLLCVHTWRREIPEITAWNPSSQNCDLWHRVMKLTSLTSVLLILGHFLYKSAMLWAGGLYLFHFVVKISWWLWCNFTSNTVPQWLKTRVVGGLSSGFSAHLFIDYHILYLDVYRFIFTLYLFL